MTQSNGYFFITAILYCTMTSSSFGFDRNRNGIPDGLEFAYFSDLVSGSSDADLDSHTNLEEINWGSDPTMQSSVPNQLIVRIFDSEMVITWPSAKGRIYVIEESSTLDRWRVLSQGQLAEIRKRIDGSEPKFYRVMVLPDFDTNGDGLSDSEEAFWIDRFGASPLVTDIDLDGQNDFEELKQGYNASKKDHPKVGLELYTLLR